MSGRSLLSPRLATYGSAVVLSVLTLAVFAYSKDQGPESAVRRYHQAVIEGDGDMLRRLESNPAISTTELPMLIRQVLGQSESATLGKVQKDGRRAYVDVIYTVTGKRGIMAVRYVVDKPELKWRVDSVETIRLLNRMSRFE